MPDRSYEYSNLDTDTLIRSFVTLLRRNNFIYVLMSHILCNGIVSSIDLTNGIRSPAGSEESDQHLNQFNSGYI